MGNQDTAYLILTGMFLEGYRALFAIDLFQYIDHHVGHVVQCSQVLAAQTPVAGQRHGLQMTASWGAGEFQQCPFASRRASPPESDVVCAGKHLVK